MILDLLLELLKLIYIPVLVIIGIIGFFILYILGYVFYFMKVKKIVPIKKSDGPVIEEPSVFARLFFDFPKQIALDYLRQDPDAFAYNGLVVFTGKQGRGKSIAMTHFIRQMQEEFPKSLVIDNYGYSKSDCELTHWSQLVDFNNGIYGVIVGMDEMQNWFSCKQSKDFPPQMLEVITQNRKNRRIICGTAQNFSNLAKDLRRQCTEVRECKTYFGCLTIVKRKEPVMDDEGNVKEYIKRGSYFFVQSDELREMYDTWKCIKALCDAGFNEQNGTVVNMYGNGSSTLSKGRKRR